MGEITKCIDKSNGNGSDFRLHGAESCAGIREGRGVGGPEAGGHEHEENIACGEVVDDADQDGGYEGKGEPAGDDEAAVIRDGVGEISGDGCTDKGDGVDRHSHVLGCDSICVAKAIDEGGVEVGECGRADNDLIC